MIFSIIHNSYIEWFGLYVLYKTISILSLSQNNISIIYIGKEWNLVFKKIVIYCYQLHWVYFY